jgi:hypothetical protein
MGLEVYGTDCPTRLRDVRCSYKVVLKVQEGKGFAMCGWAMQEHVEQHKYVEQMTIQKPINKLRLSLECCISRPTQTRASRCSNTFAFATENVNLFLILIAVLENVPRTQGYRKEQTFRE